MARTDISMAQVMAYADKYSILRHTLSRLRTNIDDLDDEGLPIARLPIRYPAGSQIVLLNKESQPEVRAVLTGDLWVEKAPWAGQYVPIGKTDDPEVIGMHIADHENRLWLDLALTSHRKHGGRPQNIGTKTTQVVSTVTPRSFVTKYELRPVKSQADPVLGAHTESRLKVLNMRTLLGDTRLPFPEGQVATVVDGLNHGFYQEMGMRIEGEALLYNLALHIHVGSVVFEGLDQHFTPKERP